MLWSLTDCGRDRGRGHVSSSRTAIEKSNIKSKVKRDTAFVVVPQNTDIQNQQNNTANNDEMVIVAPSNKKLKPVVHKDNLPNPPKIIFQRPVDLHTPEEYIKSYNITGEMRELIIACDYDSKTVRNNAVALVDTSPGDFNLGQICDIFDFCYQNWSYVNDPLSKDYFSKASETLKNGLNGDCDDFAILLCSAILAIGGDARINFANDGKEGHAFAEVNIGKTNLQQVKNYLTARYGCNQIWYQDDSNGDKWLNLDWQANYPGGKYWKYNQGKSFNIIKNIYTDL